MNVPVYKDVNTPSPFVEKYPASNFPEGADGALPDHIYLDCMCFGMGCSCLQVTFQACNIDEARRLYDQLAPLAPLMVLFFFFPHLLHTCLQCCPQLAISAGAPIWRGYLADTDVRWSVISGSVDDRTKEEMGQEPLKNNRFLIPKSRYDSVDRYISKDAKLLPQYNDLKAVYDQEIYDTLTQEGIDPLLAHRVAHLFIRDPIVIYKEWLDQDDEESSDHFEVFPLFLCDFFSFLFFVTLRLAGVEPPIHKLANHPLQASPASQPHWVEGGVPLHGGAADRI